MVPRGGKTGDRLIAPAVVALLAAMVLGVLAFSAATDDDNRVEVGAGATVDDRQAEPAGGGEPEPAAAWVPDRPGDYLSFDGSPPAAHPPTAIAAGPFVLDGPFTVATDLLGPADEIVPDLAGWLHRWELPGDAVIGVTMWEDDTFQIAGIHATVPNGSPTRVAMTGDAVLGTSTVGEIAGALGADFRPAEHAEDDFVVMAVECVGPFPVVVKLDAEGPRPAPTMLERQASGVLIGYADAAPGEPPCDA